MYHLTGKLNLIFLFNKITEVNFTPSIATYSFSVEQQQGCTVSVLPLWSAGRRVSVSGHTNVRICGFIAMIYCCGPEDAVKAASWGRVTSGGMRTSFAAELQ